MKVLFLSQIVPYPPHGGVLQRGYYLLRELGRHAQVHLLAFVHPDVLPDAVAIERSRDVLRGFCAEIEYFDLWPKGSRMRRVAALAAAAWSTSPFSVIAHRSTEYRQAVERALSLHRFDVIHADTVALSQFVPSRSGAAAVLTHHNIESVLMERRARVERALGRGFYLLRESRKLRAYEARVSPTFDVNIVVSDRDAEMLSKLVPGVRAAVVPNGVDIEYFTPDGLAESPSLIYTGGMNMLANRDAVLHFLEKIWPHILSRVPHARFFAVGQDPPRGLVELAARDRRIIATGFVSDIRPYVRDAAVYVVPLRVGGGTRLKVLDAMAMGKALVSTTIGCEGIDVEPERHLVVADTPREFADATVSLLADPLRRAALGSAARALVEQKYNWPVIGEALMSAYEMALATNRMSA